MARNDTGILEAALIGYQIQLQQVESAIADGRPPEVGRNGTQFRSGTAHGPGPEEEAPHLS